jgi:hypothetical protein
LDRNSNPACNATETRKCQRCSRLHKPCQPLPVEFHARFNSLLRRIDRLNVDWPDDNRYVAAFAQAKRDFVSELDAFVRKKAKFGGTKKPKGEALTLLLVEGLTNMRRGMRPNQYEAGDEASSSLKLA